jgi:hypothetical protein
MRRKAILLLGGLGVVAAAASVWVEVEADYKLERLGGDGPHRALVLYHPSRDAGFSDDLSLAFAEGLKSLGYAVDRASVAARTPGRPEGYALLAAVSNTYWWSPDLPTQRYLARAQWKEIPAVGLIGGSGSTERSERALREALLASGTRSYWLWRPNDEARMNEANRGVALDMARKFGVEAGRMARAGQGSHTP